MSEWSIRCCITALMIACASFSGELFANGEAIDGFPTYNERVLMEWVNRARSDPQADLAACPSGNCLDKACYASSIAPRYMTDDFNHSTRFHSSHMMLNNYFDHPSHCTLKSNVDSLFPATCSGAASCSCTQGALTTNTATWTGPFDRIALFGASGTGEIIAAGYPGPDATFYGWLYEPAGSSTCGFTEQNGHRWLILENDGTTTQGAGYVPSTGGATYSNCATMDFGSTAPAHPQIPSGSHYPQQAASVDAYVNWYDTAGPKREQINVDGVCSNLALARGSVTNGAWHATISGVGAGCHRYVFSFTDSSGKTVLYPSTGSLAIGNGGAQCPDWSSAAPAACDDEIFADGFE